MDFDLSKENIQPLRGGRNVSQLEVALQAQSDAELQQELLQQKSTFEEAIRTYVGDDPLDNWYNFISWVEQSYPKHGHEGNLVPLLEDCLSKFENDERYIHDRRFCKLWIKYIDLQQNPLELFQLLYSKGICKSCADLYRAWAYYHEAASDFKKADIVFQLGLREMAQPYEELVFAHKNMYEAFGRHSLQGVDEARLIEQRQALTSLKTYKHNHRTVVPSVRVGNQVLSSAPGLLQQNMSRLERNSNVPIGLYEDPAIAGPSIGGASAVISVLDIARKQEVQKENTIKPGTWKKSIITKKMPHNHVPSFTVHEDEDSQFSGGIRLPPGFISSNQDDFSTWITDLYYPEPYDESHVPMYPKSLVYAEQNTEYSLEEIRARKWFTKQQQSMVDASDMQETMMEEANIVIQRNSEVEQAVNSILPPDDKEIEQPLTSLVREQLERQSPVIVQNFSSNESVHVQQNPHFSQQTDSHFAQQNDSHFAQQNDSHFDLPKHTERQSMYSIFNQEHFNPEIQTSMFAQSYMPTNISGFHLANSTKNPDPIYQPSDNTMHNCVEDFHAAASGSSGSFVFYQNFPQEECSIRPLSNTSERFINQSNSSERFISQNSIAERFINPNNSERFVDENNSAERFISQNNAERFVTQNNSAERIVNQNNSAERFTTRNNSIESVITQNNSAERFVIQNNSAEPFVTHSNSTNRFITQNSSAERFIPQNNYVERFLTQNNSSERFIPQNISSERFIAQNSSVERFIPQNNSSDRFITENNSVDRFQQHQSSHLDKSGIYQLHTRVSQPVSAYQQNNSSNYINSSAKMYQPPESSASSFNRDVSSEHLNYNNTEHIKNQQWLPNNGSMVLKLQQWPNATTSSDDNYTVNMREAIKDINEILTDNTTHIQPLIKVKKPEISKFQIHEDTKLQDMDNKQSVSTGVKRSPFAVFVDDEGQSSQNKSDTKLHFSIYEDDDKQKSPPQKLRPSMRTPFTTQSEPQIPIITIGIPEFSKDEFVRPADVKKSVVPFPVFEDDENGGATGFTQPLNDSCTTQSFNFNLNQSKASTPFNYKKVAVQQFTNSSGQNTDMRQSKKVLFEENQEEEAVARFANQEETRQEKLSVIFEKSNESRYSSSSSSSGTTLKTTTFHRESLKVIPEASYSNDESMKNRTNTLPKQLETEKKCFAFTEEKYTEITKTKTTSTYDDLKMLLKEDVEDNQIDITDDDIIQPHKMKFKEKLAGDATYLRQSAVTNYVSPVKNLFREMSCDSNDSFSNSPTKGYKMEVDIQALNTPNITYDLQMEQETQDIPVTNVEKHALLPSPSDPFSPKLISTILRKVGFPKPQYAKQYFKLPSLPRLCGRKETACFIDKKYYVEKVVGKGAFGWVYKATDISNNELVALKFQKPANTWEYYITKEVQERITNSYMKIAYMNVTACYISPLASVLVSQFHKIGSLLDITNKVKQVSGKGLKELIAIYYASEIITIVNTLHKCKIIHADIKPDNFLVTKMPPEFGYPSLQLIDFGSSIDMSLFPEKTSFTSVVNTENFICTEMKDGRPWTYQTDIFCVAATIHVLLFDKYMQVKKSGSAWSISHRIPRYLQTDLWKSFFFEMLNIESCEKLPNLDNFKLRFEEITSKQSEELQMEMKLMANSVLGR